MKCEHSMFLMWLYFSMSIYNLHIFSHSEFNFWVILRREYLDRVTWEAEAIVQIKNYFGGFPGGAVVENPPANAGDTGSSPGLGRSHMPRSN